jgi:hypothetical protein
MSTPAAAPAARKEFKPFTPEERASFLAYRFGSTLDWSSRILVELKYPFELRWFVDAIQGICKGKDMRIAHATVATRAQRFMNPSQAKSLVIRAIEANNEWARRARRMIFDIERPKPREMEGKEKRARTRYTDYLTPAVVWAQEAEQRAKKADELRWKKDSKHRFTVRQQILEEALKQLPGFENVEDMPVTATTTEESKELPLSEYVEQRERILLAENQRILGKLQDGQPTDVDEIDARIAALEVFYARAKTALDHGYESARSALLSLRQSRCVRMMDFSDPEEVVAEVDEILAAKGVAGVTLSTNITTQEEGIKGIIHDPLSDAFGVTDEDDFEEVVIEDVAPVGTDDGVLSQLDCALSYAALGIPVFPTKPNKAPYTPRGFKDACKAEATIRAWWGKWPDAGIGIPTGQASGWLVLDRDDRHGGDASLTALVEEHGDLPMTSQATTPSGGAHYVFKYPPTLTLGNSAGKLGAGLDTRGEGGYIVAPGVDASRRWVNALDPADPPEWMIGALLSEKHEPVNTDRRVLHYPVFGSRTFPEGTRDDAIRDVAYGRWVNGWAESEADLINQMLEVNAARCLPPLPHSVVVEKARRTARKFARGERRREATA